MQKRPPCLIEAYDVILLVPMKPNNMHSTPIFPFLETPTLIFRATSCLLASCVSDVETRIHKWKISKSMKCNFGWKGCSPEHQNSITIQYQVLTLTHLLFSSKPGALCWISGQVCFDPFHLSPVSVTIILQYACIIVQGTYFHNSFLFWSLC